MKGTILDYTSAEVFILLDDDSVITLPLATVNSTTPIGSTINISSLYNGTYSTNYKPVNLYDKAVDFF